jgi:hypothetical protein
MCPTCIANMTLIADGAGSTGGLTEFAMKKFFLEPTENIKQTKLEESKMKIETMEAKTELSEMESIQDRDSTIPGFVGTMNMMPD